MKRTILAAVIATSIGQAHATGSLWDQLGVATQDEVAQVDSRVDHVNGRVDTTNRHVDHVNDRVDISRRKEAKLADRIDTTNRQVKHVDGRVDTAMGKAEKAHDRIDTTNRQVGDANDRITKAKRESEYRDSIQNASIDQFRRSDQRHAAGIQRNAADIAELQGETHDLRAGVAGAVAAASHQFDVSAHSGAQVSIAGGYYEGENAASLAVGGPLGERSFFNINATLDSRGNDAYGVGATFKIQ